ncbi:GDSL-type esterase/lipase family protein [Bradyrhizobium sp. WSM2793]|uniref:GDSL-type esterase/lipase family protein n=1 Tax=Bradyrhizobium sp. WSM2793 TaxID=1038866 RepID=UPI00036D87BB|nr:GDSL-type esterase/lipase family protein [Bradyrhizobium sp. WSM2793]
MKLRLGTSITLFTATLTLRATVIVATVCIALGWATSHSVRAEERVLKIVVLGDILTSEYYLPAGYAFHDKLEFALRAKGRLVKVVNASVNHDSAARGLARLNQSVTDDADAVILELGGNDMLRGTEPNVTRTALAAILRNLETRRIVALLCGARPHTNFGDEYEKAFAAMFSGLASEYNVLFYPAFDDAFVDDAQLKARDGLRPNAAGIEAVVTRILPKVEALMDRARRKDR